MAMSPAEILKICNDIIINQRIAILELGSGASTVFIARTMPEKSKLLSVDHDPNWLAIVASWLDLEGLRDRVTLIHAPLQAVTIPGYQGAWYDVKTLEDELAGLKVDCLIVDGPPAGENPSLGMARYPAVPVLKNYMAASYSIYLDDVTRHGERKIVIEWAKILGQSFSTHLDTGGYAVTTRGNYYMS